MGLILINKVPHETETQRKKFLKTQFECTYQGWFFVLRTVQPVNRLGITDIKPWTTRYKQGAFVKFSSLNIKLL